MNLENYHPIVVRSRKEYMVQKGGAMNNMIKMALAGTILGFSYGYIFGYIPMQVQLLKNAVKNADQVINCAGCDFRGVSDLIGMSIPGFYAPGVTFQPCAPTAANKNNGLMICVPNQFSNLMGVNFLNGNFFSSCFDFAILDKADLSGADFTNSSVQNATLKDAKVTGIITKDATFCNSVMPDGALCTESWTGQGVTIACNCTDQGKSTAAQSVAAEKPAASKKTSQN